VNPPEAAPPEPFRTNREIENAAIEFVIAQEKLEERTAHEARREGATTDIVSDGRIIEIKAAGTTARGQDVWLEKRQYDAALADPEHFWLYIVENVRQGDPTKFRLLRIGGESLATLLRNARAQSYYTVPFPVAVYDALTTVGATPAAESPEPIAGT
jgi:hypothetical protein